MNLKHTYESYIRTTPEKLWEALTDGKVTQQYYYGGAVQSDWRVKSPVRYYDPSGNLLLDGEVLAVQPRKKLETTFIPSWDPSARSGAPTRVRWEIEPVGDACKLTVVHEGFASEGPLFHQVGAGWNVVLSGLKTVLETGKPLQLPPMA